MLLLLVFGPMLYVRWTMARHGAERADFPGTGGELARHLLDEAGLNQVPVELTDKGDHYDPVDRVVRLGEAHFNGRSVTAVAVAAHEVGHAVQHRDGMPAFGWRIRLVRVLIPVQRVVDVLFLVGGLGAIALRAPVIVLAEGALLVGMMALSVAVHLVTLPVELDASWRRALPALATGYISEKDMPAARSVLRAAALTYVASALMSLLNVARLARLFR
nr:zinc metallopeptidase [Plastoroseomonas arctica]